MSLRGLVSTSSSSVNRNYLNRKTKFINKKKKKREREISKYKETKPVVGLLFVYNKEEEEEEEEEEDEIITMKKKKRAADDRKCHRS